MTLELKRLIPQSPRAYWDRFFDLSMAYSLEHEPGNVDNIAGRLREGVMDARRRQIEEGEKCAIIALEKVINGIYFHGYSLFTPRKTKNSPYSSYIDELMVQDGLYSEDTERLLIMGVAHEIRRIREKESKPQWIHMEIPIGSDNNLSFYQRLGFEICKKQKNQGHFLLRVPLKRILNSFEVKKR